MDEPLLIWRFGRWIAQRHPGRVRLGWTGGDLELLLRDGMIVGAEGPDPEELGVVLGPEDRDERDLITRAHAIAEQKEVSETETVARAKELIQKCLTDWIRDPERRMEIAEEVPETCSGHCISATHALVEVVLSDPAGELARCVLPDLEILLRRCEGFLELYAPLRLSEDADLIVAKITGQRTAREITSRSPHPEDEVLPLLAALTAAGLLEAIPVAVPSGELDITADRGPDIAIAEPGAVRHRVSPFVLLAAAAGVALIATIFWWVLLRNGGPPAAADPSGHFGVVVDLGCEPHEYRRLLEITQRHQNVRAIAISNPDEEIGDCWRLVWGDFPTRAEAESSLSDIPGKILREGFEPHVVEVPAEGEEQAPDG